MIRKLDRVTTRARDGLRDAWGDDFEELEVEVNTGAASLWESDGTYFLLRGETLASGRREMVVCAMQGRGAVEIMKRIMTAARAQDYDSVRFHTRSAGLGRMARPLGFERSEYVYRCEIKGKQNGR